MIKNNVKDFRLKAGLTQIELSKIVGCSKNTISSIETGLFCPTAFLAAKLCLAFDCKFDDLFYIL